MSYILSGMVFEVTGAGRAPIKGSRSMRRLREPARSHVRAYRRGWLVSFSWTLNGLNPLFVTKAGYAIVDTSRTLLDRYGRVEVTVNGDTRFDIQLEHR